MSERARRLLGVSPDAHTDEIRRAYRRLVKTAHPDLHPNDVDAERRFRDIQSAFVELTSNHDEQPSPRPKTPDSQPPAQRVNRQTQPPASGSKSGMGVLWWLPVIVVVTIMVIVAAVTDDDGSQEIAVTPEVCVRITDPVSGDGVPVNCSTPHEISLYQRGVITQLSGIYPGEEALEEHTMSLCDRSFRAIIGGSPSDGGYRITSRYPSAGEWTAGDRDFDCLAARLSGELIEGPLSPDF